HLGSHDDGRLDDARLDRLFARRHVDDAGLGDDLGGLLLGRARGALAARGGLRATRRALLGRRFLGDGLGAARLRGCGSGWLGAAEAGGGRRTDFAGLGGLPPLVAGFLLSRDRHGLVRSCVYGGATRRRKQETAELF